MLKPVVNGMAPGADAAANPPDGAGRAASLRMPGSGWPVPQDRACPPEVTLARIRPHYPELGITRVGLVTGLDRIGVPIGFAVRPNGLSLSVHQGKGLTDAAALVSAAMEAVEVACAERAGARAVTMMIDGQGGGTTPVVDLARLTRCRARRIAPGAPLAMSAGVDLVTGGDRMVPTALVSIDHTNLGPDDPFDRSSDGLASGNTADEAVLHGLLELVERDAAALARAAAPAVIAGRKRSPETFSSVALDDIHTWLVSAGLALALFDITSDVGVPVVAALVAPADLALRPDLTAAAVCGGYACHHDPGVAAVRAATEACQARATAIAGARDDIGLDWYRRADAAGASLSALSALFAAPAAAVPIEAPAAPPLSGRIDDVVARLVSRGMREVVAVPIACPIADIHVVRMIVPGLEVGPGAGGRHVGARLLRAMLGTAP